MGEPTDTPSVELEGQAPPSVPTDEQIKAQRIAEKRRAALATARANLAAKKAAAKTEKPEGREDSALLEAGCRQLVRLCYGLAGLGARMAGGKLDPLSDEERAEGAKEAALLVRRWRWLAFTLSFIGFPLWLGEKIGSKFRRKGQSAGTVHALPSSQKEQAG